MAKKKGMGMGIDALFMDNETELRSGQTLRISEIEPNKNQPRTDFDDTALEALADSIRKHGVLQPILVRPLENGNYQIVAGERRWRASRMAGLSEVPVYIKELSNQETKQLALIENLQREDLNPIEEALGYKDLMESYEMTQEEVAEVVGKSRPVITNALRILKLDDEIIEMVRQGEISSGHAKVLVGVEEKKDRLELAEKVKNDLLTVRGLEALAKKLKKEPKDKPIQIQDSYFKEIELSLASYLGRKVRVVSKKGKNVLEIEFYGKDDLVQIANELAKDK